MSTLSVWQGSHSHLVSVLLCCCVTKTSQENITHDIKVIKNKLRYYSGDQFSVINMQCASDMVSSLLWYTEDENSTDKEPKIIEQFVQEVEEFSSQYGSEISISYTAFNIRGPPSNYPDYGDYPQAFVMVCSKLKFRYG